MTNKISAVIITKNEERNIERCLKSLKGVADEIIVIDSFSTDRTEDICKQFEVKFVKREFIDFSSSKNYGNSLSKYPFILSIDADEEISEDLKKSILHIKFDLKDDGYSFNRKTNYCGQWINHCGWYPDTKLRLFRKTKAHWSGVIHETLELRNGSNKILKGDLLHYSYHNFNDHFRQIEKFTTISSKAAFDSGQRTNVFMIIVKPWFKFIRDYFIKLGFLDGFYGFVICINSSYANFLKYLKLYELQGKSL